MTQAEFEKYMDSEVKPFCESLSESLKSFDTYTLSDYRSQCLSHAMLFVGGDDASLTGSQLREIVHYVSEQVKTYGRMYKKYW